MEHPRDQPRRETVVTWWQILSLLGGALAGTLFTRFVLELIAKRMDRR